MAYVRTYWNSAPIKAKVRTASARSMVKAKGVAMAKAKWRHVRSSVYVRTSGTKGVVGASAPDAMRLEKGTHPHTEGPRTKEAMKFPNGGFARGEIQHPGTKGEPFLKPAAEAWPAIVKAELRRELA